MNREELAARLLGTFVGELEEQVSAMNADLLALEADTTDPERLKSLFRAAHTIKGAARAANVPPVEQVCHALENILAQARDGTRVLDRDDLPLLFAVADALADAGTRLRHNRDLADSALGEVKGRLKVVTTGRLRAKPSTPASPATVPAQTPRVDPRASQVRVEAERLDGLLASSGQLQVASGRVSGRVRELVALQESLDRYVSDWTRTDRRLRLALERAEPPGGLLQAMNGLRDDLRRIAQELSRLTNGVVGDARQLSRASDELGHRVRQVRLRPFSDAVEALPRMIRDLAVAAKKEVDFQVRGGEIGVDRAVLAGLREALVPLVRNALDHGIESPADRERLGKPRRGALQITAALDADRLTVTVSDDGGGLDVAAIRARLESRGVAVPEAAADLAQALFEGGFTTRAETTVISGRGVGLDIVRNTMERIRGVIDVSWTAGRGTTFTLECPPTLATIRALIGSVGTPAQAVAIPTSHVERLYRIQRNDVRMANGRHVMTTSDGAVPIVPLARLLPPVTPRVSTGPLWVVLLRAGGRRLGVILDELLAEQSIVLQPLPPSRRPPPYVSGASVLGMGRVVLALNPVALIAGGLGVGHDAAGFESASGPAAERSRIRILVVDDSITTRTLEQSILESAGYEVLTAVDGADAWRAVQERGCDLVVSDVEMPRMDGIALCETVRASVRFKGLPVVLVTARESEDDRARGLKAGADAYLGKSAFDKTELLETIRQLVGQGAE